jgi:tyrosyl-tRNA synthetase
MYGKVMSIRDELIPVYFKMATDLPMDIITQIEKDMSLGANPRDTKASLAREIVARYNGRNSALSAEKSWNSQFRDGDKPQAIPTYSTSEAPILDVIAKAFKVSKSEARRVIMQGGIKLDSLQVKDLEITIKSDCTVQFGKRRYANIKIKK